MRGAVLFARTRSWLAVAAVTVASGLLILVCGPLGYSLNPRSGYLVAVAAQVPLLSAIAIQASLASRVSVQEAMAARSLRSWRALHVIALTALAAAVLGLAAAQLRPALERNLTEIADVGAVAEVRNLLALTGAALVGAAILGQKFGWILPLAWAILPYLLVRGSNPDPIGLATVLVQPDSAFVPWIAALGVWIVGTALAMQQIGRKR